MIKRQDSQLLSSSRRQTPPPPPEKQSHAKTVGCMSGIFKLISKYQNRKKLLTFGKKVEKKAITVATKRANGGMVKDEEEIRYRNKNVVPRSPMLSPKLRKPNATEKVPETARKPPEAVDGLMAVEEEQQPGSAWEKEESSEKKRQKLLEALEKCNEDLEALKMIIKAVKPLVAAAAEPPCLVDSGDVDGGAEEMCMKKCEDDEKNEKVRSELWNNLSFTNNFKCHNNENAEQHNRSQSKTNPERYNRIGARCFSKFVKEPYGIRRKPISNEVWASSAMVRNVEEVCNDIIWGEKREVANIGVMLHNHICKDLIEETIKELGNHKMYRFPLHGCKRRLSF